MFMLGVFISNILGVNTHKQYFKKKQQAPKCPAVVKCDKSNEDLYLFYSVVFLLRLVRNIVGPVLRKVLTFFGVDLSFSQSSLLRCDKNL